MIWKKLTYMILLFSIPSLLALAYGVSRNHGLWFWVVWPLAYTFWYILLLKYKGENFD